MNAEKMAKRIRSRRNKLKMPQTELADRCFIAQPSICNFELGKMSPTLETFWKLVDVLDCDPAWLAGR